MAAAFLKPADLGSGWRNADDTGNKQWSTQYAWGCGDDSSGIHQIGRLPAKRVSLRDDWDFFIEQTVLFPDESAAEAAQAALENQPRSCAGTHRVPGLGGGEATDDTIDFAPVTNQSGFSGMAEHIASLGVKNGVNESVRIEVRQGPLLVFVYYDLASEQDPNPAKRHTTFARVSEAVIAKALRGLAATATTH